MDKDSNPINITNQKSEPKFLTVVFWDIRGFSTLCDRLETIPESAVEFLKEYYAVVKRVVSNHGGTVEKFMGDGVMALFGFKGRDNEDGTNDDAICAIYAALELRDSFQDIKSEWHEKWRREVGKQLDIGLKCGIHSGKVLVAELGTEKTVIGSVVNYASRFAGSADDKQRRDILISQTTDGRINSIFFPPHSLIAIKNLQRRKSFGDYTECYSVLGTADEIMGGRPRSKYPCNG